MEEIKATAKFRIHEGNIDAFKAIIPEIISVVKEKDPGTLTYEWYLNEQQMECVVLEVYADSEAVMAHAGNVGEQLQALLSLSDFSIEIYGNPTDELSNALSGFNSNTYAYSDGFSK